jgi:serine/threonine protein kinase
MAAASGSGLAAVKALKEHGAVKALKEHGAEEGSGHLVAELRPNPPMQLKNFHVMTTLGTGTFGRVRIVKNLSDNSTHALKIMKKEAIIRLNQLDHVLSEVDLMMRLEHPFIVNMVGMFQDALTVYLVLEYVPGGEVFTILREEGRFTSAQSIFYGAEICLAFEYLHKYSIAYRDLKPENLLISKGGHIKITDFGFAKLIPPGEKAWTLCGTPEYLAPEIIQSKGHGAEVDWWAFGVMLYEFQAGYPPFDDDHPFGIYQKILTGKIEWPRHFSNESRSLITELLKANNTERFGCLKNGADDIKSHKFFAGTDWDAIFMLRVDDIPFEPELNGDDDVSNFDDYPDSIEKAEVTLSSEDNQKFDSFRVLFEE